MKNLGQIFRFVPKEERFSGSRVGDISCVFYASGEPCGKLSGDGSLYFREIPSLNEQLHVHVRKGKVTGANIKGRPLTNYEAAMLDLRGELEGGRSGGKKW